MQEEKMITIEHGEYHNLVYGMHSHITQFYYNISVTDLSLETNINTAIIYMLEWIYTWGMFKSQISKIEIINNVALATNRNNYCRSKKQKQILTVPFVGLSSSWCHAIYPTANKTKFTTVIKIE